MKKHDFGMNFAILFVILFFNHPVVLFRTAIKLYPALLVLLRVIREEIGHLHILAT